MFLANSLKDKLKKEFIESESSNLNETLHPYKPPPKDPRAFLTFREGEGETTEDNLIPQNFFSTQKLQSLDRKEWENTFTLKKLRSEWKTRVKLDFENNFKKFPDDFISPEILKSKKEVENLVDPDKLELKKKQWNISYNTTENFKPELSKKLFEINSGLKDFKVVPIKQHKIEEGVESRNHIEIDGNAWNISNQISLSNFKKEDKLNLSKAKDNSLRYWKTNSELRSNEMPFPIPEEKKKIEVIRYFKKYRTPIQKDIDFYNTMEKIKDNTFIEREKAEQKVLYKNPGCEKYPEKINALVFKEMSDIYKYKYNELIGKLSKEELKKKQREKNRFKWSDKDLVNKIVAINSITNSPINENKINNYAKTYTEGNMNKNSKNIFANISDSQDKNRKILLPLVAKGTEIQLEEEKIQDRLLEEYKRKKKRELILNFGKNKKVVFDKFESKYPLNKSDYENLIKSPKDDEINLNKSATEIDVKDYWSNISKSSHCGQYFLEAYNKIAGEEIKKMKSVEKKNREEMSITYSHPGTFREFVFDETVKTDEDQNNIYQGKKVPKKLTKIYLWSCCMNSDKNSRGCQKKITKNFRWIYSP